MTALVNNALKITALICTYNRAEYLERVFESLERQTLPRTAYEVVIINDGSTDNTAEIVERFKSTLPIRYFYQDNAGLAAAKNAGIDRAEAPLIVFMDDDDIATPELLEEHVKVHLKNPDESIAVLGHTDLEDPTVSNVPLMHFVTKVGYYLFCYPIIKDQDLLDYTYFWGGRSSCKVSFLKKYGVFNPVFRFGCEDIELGYRLSKHGLKVIYHKPARSIMIRALTIDGFFNRLIKQGRSQYVCSRMHVSDEIQKWTEVEGTEDEWKMKKDQFEAVTDSARHLDSFVNKSMEMNLNVEHSTRKLLHQAYWYAFRACKLKGIYDKKNELAENKVQSKGQINENVSRGPDFIGIGAQKCATTFIYEVLRKHPEVCFPATDEKVTFPVIELDGKEIKTWPKEIQFLAGPNSSVGWDTYMDIFEDKLSDIHYGEISPCYLAAPLDRIKELKSHVPDVKLFVVLRNPIERDWSAIRMIAERKGTLDNEVELVDMVNWAHIEEMGNYVAGIEKWLSVFPKSSLKIMFYEHLTYDIDDFFSELSDFIGIDPDYFSEIKKEVVFKGPDIKMPIAVRNALIFKHKTQVSYLEKLLPDKALDWMIE